MQMNGINTLITAAAHYKEWKDPRLVVLVLNNHDLNQVTWELRAMSGDPKFPASQDLPDFPYAAYAESLGLYGVRIDRPDQVARTWKEVFKVDRPVLVEAITDPDVPPLPPHITVKQAKALTSALLSGDPNARGIIRQSYRDMIENWIPHRG
jgi:pyruvate dehydrogenase (quinone)